MNVRFTSKSGHQFSALGCPLGAKSRHSAQQQRLALFDQADACLFHQLCASVTSA